MHTVLLQAPRGKKPCHAKPIALMALKMMELSEEVLMT